jgi:hypothetical protein
VKEDSKGEVKSMEEAIVVNIYVNIYCESYIFTLHNSWTNVFPSQTYI